MISEEVKYHIKPFLKKKGYNLSSIANGMGMSFQRFDHHIKIREDLSYNFALKLAKHIDIKLDDLMKAVTI
jgi:hypothetical protein|tara:strand:+ start:1762 stop:1974 length:213 start_codon:yes stop_codon:yes gene_type:complete